MRSKLIFLGLLCLYVNLVQGCKDLTEEEIILHLETAQKVSLILRNILGPIRKGECPELKQEWIRIFNGAVVRASICQCELELKEVLKNFFRQLYETSEHFKDFDPKQYFVQVLLELNPMTTAMLMNMAVTSESVYEISNNTPLITPTMTTQVATAIISPTTAATTILPTSATTTIPPKTISTQEVTKSHRTQELSLIKTLASELTPKYPPTTKKTKTRETFQPTTHQPLTTLEGKPSRRPNPAEINGHLKHIIELIINQLRAQRRPIGPVRPGQPVPPNRTDRTDRTDRPNRTDRPDRPDRTDRHYRTDRPNRTDIRPVRPKIKRCHRRRRPKQIHK